MGRFATLAACAFTAALAARGAAAKPTIFEIVHDNKVRYKRCRAKDAALCGDLRRLAPNARREAGDAQLLTGAAKPPPHNPWERPLSSSRGSEVKPPIGRLGLKEDFPSTAVQRP